MPLPITTGKQPIIIHDNETESVMVAVSQVMCIPLFQLSEADHGR